MSRCRVNIGERVSLATDKQAAKRPLMSESLRRYSSISAAFVCVSCISNRRCLSRLPVHCGLNCNQKYVLPSSWHSDVPDPWLDQPRHECHTWYQSCRTACQMPPVAHPALSPACAPDISQHTVQAPVQAVAPLHLRGSIPSHPPLAVTGPIPACQPHAAWKPLASWT
jgi:hypothetical protein